MNDRLPLVDTNILVYAYDTTQGEKHKIANEIVRKLWLARIIHTIFDKFRSNAVLERVCAIFQAQIFLTLCFFSFCHCEERSDEAI